MANIEWKQVQSVPGNPVDGFRTFMEGMRGAEAAARGIRQNQLQNTDMSLKIMDSITRDQQAAQASMDRQAIAAQTAMDRQARAAAKPQPFDRQVLGIAARDHYYSGGTMDDFQFGGFDPYNKEQYNFVSGVFKESEDNLKLSIEQASEQLGRDRAAAFEKLKRDLPDEGSPAYLDEFNRLTQEYAAREGSIHSTQFELGRRKYLANRNSLGLGLGNSGANDDALFAGSAARQLESKATGATPKQKPQGSTGNPSFAQSRIAEKDAVVNNQADVRDRSIAAIEEAFRVGDLTEEEAAAQIALAHEQYDEIIQDFDNEWDKSVMTGADGSVYGTDFQYNEDGSITVSGQKLSPEVSSAIQEAAEISGIPVDMQLAMYGAESRYNPKAVSKTGAGGLGQLTGPAIKDVIQNYPEKLEAAGIPLSANMDRLDPRTNAIVSSLYMKLQHEKYLGGKGSIEDRYVAYNIGVGNSFIANERFANADPNTPIDQIGFPVSSDAVQKNIEVYRKPNGQWRNKNEVYSEIRRRMGITKASPEEGNPTKSIEEKIAIEKDRVTDENATTPSELSSATQEETPTDAHISRRYEELLNTNPTTSPEAFANIAGEIADSIIPDPGAMKGESVANLDVTFYEEALKKADVPADSKTVARIREAFIKDPELRRLGSTEVSMIISFAEKGMWGGDLDMAGLRTNIKKIRQNQANNRTEYRQFVDDSEALKNLSNEIKTSVLNFNKYVASEQKTLDSYKYKLNNTDDLGTKARMSRAINSTNDEMAMTWTLHEQNLKRLTTDALDRAKSIETKHQHLKEIFNNGVSNQATKDMVNLKSEADARNYRDPVDNQLKTHPKFSTEEGAYFGPHWGY